MTPAQVRAKAVAYNASKHERYLDGLTTSERGMVLGTALTLRKQAEWKTERERLRRAFWADQGAQA